MSFLINKCFFTIDNLVFKQNIGIAMSMDSAPFCANLFLCFFESKYIKQAFLHLRLLLSANNSTVES